MCLIFLFISAEASLKEVHISSRTSFATGPISLHLSCRLCRRRNAVITSSSSVSLRYLVEKKLLFGQIFLEVIVAEFLVDFPLVVECFHGILIVFPYRSGVLWRHFAYLFEFALYLLDTLIVTVDIVSVGAKSFKFVDQGFLFVKISGLTCFYFGSLTRFLLFDGGKGSLEPFFDRIFGVSECFALFATASSLRRSVSSLCSV